MPSNILPDEVEYFGFLPVSFTIELQDELEKILIESLDGQYAHLKPKMHEMFRRNLFLFSNFVLRNVLVFPAGFRWERRRSDKVVDVDLEEKMVELVILKENLEKRRRIYHEGRVELIKLENRRGSQLCLLESSRRLQDGMDLYGEFERDYESLLGQFGRFNPSSGSSVRKLKKFMEHKYMKQEYYQAERRRLTAIGERDVLESLAKSINRGSQKSG
ncbi:hypothetical protein ECANGB1_1256 [Enterospora canceri]|uniref:Uncharacterized protein n=1 Tax=Enterospora canceri TaxID=1081671 RepID=A0A1Y1S772_9MICR|nr:hypothetical protein ECANGB1_1256 [Enterospora canceri]